LWKKNRLSFLVVNTDILKDDFPYTMCQPFIGTILIPVPIKTIELQKREHSPPPFIRTAEIFKVRGRLSNKVFGLDKAGDNITKARNTCDTGKGSWWGAFLVLEQLKGV
jgi:hypothetical protein